MPVDYNAVPSPCYVIDEERLRRNLIQISSIAKQSGTEFILAFKGFAMWSVFPIVREYVGGAAASSLSEARLCFEEMKSEAHTYAPVYDEREFDEIMGYSSHITFNSLNQYKKFWPRIENSGKKISVGLRINPEFSEIAHGLYNPCSPGSRLGITAAELGNDLPEGVEGLHFHVLFESDSYTLERTLAAVEEKFGHLLAKAKWINMGGGHLVTRKGYDSAHMIGLLRNFRLKHNLHVILEPGSAFAWETGELVATVEDIVVNGGIKTAMLNVSFTAHMPDCLEMPYKPMILGATDPQSGKPVYRLGGNSCLSGDFIGDWSFEKDLMPGDRIVFLDMIHYTMVKTSTFNGVAHPSIGIWQSDGRFRMVRQFGYSDYRDRLS
jgi:carboxynorspermidine decarboxylase